MANVTMLCPATGNKTHKVNGRTYTGVVGTPQVVPDFDAKLLEANGWMSGGQLNGTFTTAARPTTGLFKDMEIMDSTLGYIIIYDGATWRNPSTGAAV